jgi:LCP family protein required for cell wall assembly
MRKRRPFRPSRKRVVLMIVGVVALVLLAVGVWFGQAIIRDVSKIFNKKGNSLLGLLADTKLKGQDRGRVNILLAGDSADDPGHGGADLTDSIMLLSINTQDHSAFMLSIPRDLWVRVPGHGSQKINAANAEGGMPLLEQVVSQDLGVPIDYYALVNYTAFKDAVNAVGGIDVTIASSDPRGLYDANLTKAEGGPLRLKNGLQHLDGQTALNLARARGDNLKPNYGFPGSDFDRTEHQRLMLTALAKKGLSAGVLANPLKVTQLLDAIGNNVQTDFQTNEIRSLMNLVKKMDFAQVKSLSFVDDGVNLIGDYTAPDGESALAPKAGVSDFSDIRAYLKKLTSNDPVVKEAAKVVVLNGSGVQGLAKKDGDVLMGKGMDVLTTDNAPAPAATTLIIDNSAGKKPGSKAALVKLLGSNVSADATANAALLRAYPTAEFIVVLGADQAGDSSDSSQ